MINGPPVCLHRSSLNYMGSHASQKPSFQTFNLKNGCLTWYPTSALSKIPFLSPQAYPSCSAGLTTKLDRLFMVKGDYAMKSSYKIIMLKLTQPDPPCMLPQTWNKCSRSAPFFHLFHQSVQLNRGVLFIYEEAI